MISHEYLAKAEAAEAAGVDPLTIYRWIKAGKLRAEKFGREVAIRKEDLARVSRSSRGPPSRKGAK